LGFSGTGSFFQGLLLTAGFSAAATGYYTGLSSVCFLFQGKDTPPVVYAALTSSCLAAIILDTVAPKGDLVGADCSETTFFSNTDLRFDTD